MMLWARKAYHLAKAHVIWVFRPHAWVGSDGVVNVPPPLAHDWESCPTCRHTVWASLPRHARRAFAKEVANGKSRKGPGRGGRQHPAQGRTETKNRKAQGAAGGAKGTTR